MIDFLQRLLRIGEYNEERTLGGERSGLWPRVRKNHLELNPKCAVCGTKKDLDVHHLVMFSVDKRLELSSENLITLCTPHHFLFGHLLNWRTSNPQCAEDSGIWRDKIRAR